MIYSLLSFILIIVILVFVHELGHYSIARYFGVRVDVFSIGFGKELYGFRDRFGTRWSLSMIPLGGYVKMFGDAGPSSTVPTKAIAALSDKLKKTTFFYQGYWPKFWIIFGGPLFNFIFSLLIFIVFFFSFGKMIVEPVIGEVVENSPAKHSGLLPNDRILAVDDEMVSGFIEMRQMILLSNGEPLTVKYKRRSAEHVTVIIPEKRYDPENKMYYPVIGVVPTGEVSQIELGVMDSVQQAAYSVYNLSKMTLRSLGQMVLGKRSLGELRGSITIAQESKKSIKRSWVDFALLLATLSVNLGVINLLPIPILDGGHLFIMTVKKLMGGAISENLEKILYLIGGVVIIFLIVISTSNDIKSLFF